MSAVRLEPVVDWIGDCPITHGERGREIDAEHPEACLCGVDPYYMCEGFYTGGVLGGAVIERNDEGGVDIYRGGFR